MCNPLFFQFLSSYGICVYLFVYAFFVLSKSLSFCKFSSSETGTPTKNVGFYEKIFKKTVDLYAFRVYSIHCQQELTAK